MGDYLKNIKKFKFNSVFVKFYVCIFVAIMAVCALFCMYIYAIHFRNFSKEIELNMSAFLTQTVEKTDSTMEILNDNITMLMMDGDIVRAVSNPSPDNASENAATAMTLKGVADNFSYFDSILLYESTENMVFSSDGTVEDFEDSRHRDIISECIASGDGAAYIRDTTRYRTWLDYHDGRLSMVCRFWPVSYDYIGTFIAEINLNKLANDLKASLRGSGYNVEIYDSQERLIVAASSIRSESIVQYADNSGKRGLISADAADDIGLHYLIRSLDTGSYTYLAYLKSVIPFMTLILIVAASLTLFAAGNVYLPINRLLRVVDTDGTSDGEVELIESSYNRLKSDTRLARDFINGARPQLESKLIADIISSVDKFSDSELERKVEALDSTLDINGMYQCFIVRSMTAADTENVVGYRFYDRITDGLKLIPVNNKLRIYPLFQNADRMSFVVHYIKFRSDIELEDLSMAFCSRLEKLLAKAGDGMTYSASGFTRGLINIGESYYEARMALRRSMDSKDESAPQDAVKETGVYIDEQLERLGKLLDNGELTLGEQQLNQILDDVRQSGLGLNGAGALYGRVLKTVMEKYLRLKPVSDDIERYDCDADEIIRLQGITDTDSLYAEMNVRCRDLYNTYTAEAGRRQNRLVAAAKDYIRDNFGDSQLSIHEVAMQVGISDTYLSTIFAENTGQGLNYYINKLRVEAACGLLKDTGKIIRDVGRETGFYTTQNFNRVFKRYTGMTPGEYRKKAAERA